LGQGVRGVGAQGLPQQGQQLHIQGASAEAKGGEVPQKAKGGFHTDIRWNHGWNLGELIFVGYWIICIFMDIHGYSWIFTKVDDFNDFTKNS